MFAIGLFLILIVCVCGPLAFVDYFESVETEVLRVNLEIPVEDDEIILSEILYFETEDLHELVIQEIVCESKKLIVSPVRVARPFSKTHGLVYSNYGDFSFRKAA